MPSRSITAGDCAGPAPPNESSAKARGSMPRWMVIWRIALAWFQLAISMMPWASCLCAHVAGKPLRQRRQAGARARDIKRDAAADQRRRNAAEHEIGVGDGRLVAAVRIAHRAGLGAGAARPDLEVALAADPGDRSAAGADGLDVDHRNADRKRPDRRRHWSRAACRLRSGRDRSRCRRHRASRRRESRRCSAITALPSAPAAGPDSAVVIGLRTTCSALATPPLDCITRNGMSLRPRPSSSCTRAR